MAATTVAAEAFRVTETVLVPVAGAISRQTSNLDVRFGSTLLLPTLATTVNLYLGQTGTAFSAALASGDAVTLTAVYESAT